MLKENHSETDLNPSTDFMLSYSFNLRTRALSNRIREVLVCFPKEIEMSQLTSNGRLYV